MTDSIRVIRRKTCNALIDSLNREPDLWKWTGTDKLSLKHANGVEIWWANGQAELYQPREVKFGWLSWFRLRIVLKRWHFSTGKAKLRAEEIHACMTVLEMFARGQVA